MLHVVILFLPISISDTLLFLCALVSSLEVSPVSVRQTLLSLCPSELRSCVKVEVAVLGSPSLIILMVSVDVKQQWTWTFTLQSLFSRFPQCPYKSHVLTLCTPTSSLEVSPVSRPERRPGMSGVSLLSGISGLLGKKNKNWAKARRDEHNDAYERWWGLLLLLLTADTTVSHPPLPVATRARSPKFYFAAASEHMNA